jgi:DNA-binding transcriptional MerR regulator
MLEAVTFYSPAETADKSGFSIDTLRYYEKIGLLSGIARDTAGRRVFTDDDLGWLHMLRCLRETGMPIAEMRRYAQLVRDGDGTLAERIELLREHDRRVEEQIARLSVQRGQIQWKVRHYTELAGACAQSASSEEGTEVPAEDAEEQVSAVAG